LVLYETNRNLREKQTIPGRVAKFVRSQFEQLALDCGLVDGRFTFEDDLKRFIEFNFRVLQLGDALECVPKEVLAVKCENQEMFTRMMIGIACSEMIYPSGLLFFRQSSNPHQR
jgi:hypothetical protein